MRDSKSPPTDDINAPENTTSATSTNSKGSPVTGPMEELKPCPNPLGMLHVCQPRFMHLMKHYGIECLDCGLSTSAHHTTREEAIKAWNTRPTQLPQVVDETIERKPVAMTNGELYLVWALMDKDLLIDRLRRIHA